MKTSMKLNMRNSITRLILNFWALIPLPDQVKRLILIFAGLIIGWILIRQQMVPATFGEDGHYRSAAVDLVISLPIAYVGQSECVLCHEGERELKEESYHRNVSCEVCHGPGWAHLEDPEENKLFQPKERGLCTLCHGYNASKPTGFPQINPRLHNPLEPCMKCHDPHDPKPPHVPAQCGACHGEIARTKSVSHHAELACTYCHETQENHKVDPRAAIPGKPESNLFCGGCHSEAAESPPQIPRVDLESHGNGELCWQCHYPHYPEVF